MIGIPLAFAKTFGSCFIQAFSDDDTYVFDFLLIEKSRADVPRRQPRLPPLILGIDPARKNDNIAMVWRRGQNVERIVCFAPPKSTDTQTADDLIWERVTREIRACYPDEIYVDVGGIGGNVPYILRSFGIETYIHEVYFNQSPENKNAYHDKCAEMYPYAKAWFKRGASVPNNDDFVKELRMIKDNPNSPKFRLHETTVWDVNYRVAVVRFCVLFSQTRTRQARASKVFRRSGAIEKGTETARQSGQTCDNGIRLRKGAKEKEFGVFPK